MVSLDDMAQVQVPLATDLPGARGLPVYFLLVDVGGPIITISKTASEFCFGDAYIFSAVMWLLLI